MTVRDIQVAPLSELFDEATHLRESAFGNHVEFCAIINVKSGLCPMNCRFCAQSKHYETASPVYPLMDDVALRQESQELWQQGVKRVGWVASGCAVDEADVIKIARSASGCSSSGQLCASLGQIGKESLERLRASGISRYHHNLETSERFYPMICSTQRWADRRKTVERAKLAGLEVCCGGLFGLGETWQDRFELAETLGGLEVDSVPINFFNPIPGTPLALRKALSVEEALRIIAMLRILLPTTSLRICGGRPGTLGHRWPEIFDAGAESLMTGNYLTTDGFSIPSDLEVLRNFSSPRKI